MTRADHLDDPDLVHRPRTRLRRSRRAMHLLLSHLGISGRTLAACTAPAGAWTVAMIVLALAVRW